MKPILVLCTVLLGFVLCEDLSNDAAQVGNLVFAEAPPSQMVAVPKRPPPSEGSCDNARFKNCQLQFAKGLNTDVSNLKDSKKFRSVVSRYYRQSSLDTGIVFLCRQRQGFQGCLGVQYDACVDPWLNMNRGQSLDNAFETSQIYRQLQFDCDGAFIQVVTHWGCIKAITGTPAFNTTFNQCVTDYQNAVQQDPTSYCTAGQVLASCVSSIFHTSTCPGSNDLVWWMCERLRAIFQLDGFCPSMKCVVPPVSQSIRDAVEHRRYGSRADALGNGAFVSQARRNFHHLVGIKNRLHRQNNVA